MKLVNVLIVAHSLVGVAVSAAVPVITEAAVMSVDKYSPVNAVDDVQIITYDLAKNLNTSISVGALISSYDTSKSVDTYISVGELIPTSSTSCIYTWCQEGTSMCIIWEEPTDWDVSLGPIPGPTHTTFDEPCSVTEASVTSSISVRGIVDEEITTLSHQRSGNGTLRTLGPKTTSTQQEEDCTEDVESLVTRSSVSVPTDVPCHHVYCEDGELYCHYQPIITGHDESSNPLPGMTSTMVGPCLTPTDAGNGYGEKITAIKE